jgi:hypothetical protein
MNRTKAKFLFLMVGWIFVFTSCERDFFIELKEGEPQFIVEAYINNELPTSNYVILSHSQSYYDTGFQSIPEVGAYVTITEGMIDADGTYQWDMTTKKQLVEVDVPTIPGGTVPGIYMDPLAFTDPSHALLGKPGKHYLLEIDTKGEKYSSITYLPQPVVLDSLTCGDHFIDSIYTKARLTLYYQDPDTIGNTQLYYWRNQFNHTESFGWGAFGSNRFLPGTDDLTNGEYMRVTPNNGFTVTDSVNYHLVSVERKVYDFWNSFNKARDNNGPFSTPVKLVSTINGENVVGCFSGLSLSTKSIIVK